MNPIEPAAPRASRTPGADPAVAAFVDLCGERWRTRISEIVAAATAGGHVGRAAQQYHAIELAVARLIQPQMRARSQLDSCVATLLGVLMHTRDLLPPQGRDRLQVRLTADLGGASSLVPLFHLVRTAALQQQRGFAVEHAGLAHGAPFDLLLQRDGAEAELSCATVSAEDGRDLHRSAWFNLVDGIDPDLQRWLSDHPGRYLLKMTLPRGLREMPAEPSANLDALANLQRRIRDMLSQQRRADFDEAAMLRLDPLMLAGAQAGELGMMDALRHQFGPEAQLAVSRSGNGVFVMAARAGRENDIGAAVRRRMTQAAPTRFSGTRPGILSMFLDNADRAEWRALRDGLQLEGETRQFLTCPEAAGLVAVSAASRVELFGDPDAAEDGELRFRNQAHPAAKSAPLAPAIRSSC